MWNVRAFGLMIYGISSRQPRKPSKINANIKKCQDRLIRRAVAFVWFLGDQLKDIDPFSNEISITLMNAAELKTLKNSHNPTLKLLFLQETDAATLIEAQVFSDTEIDHFRNLQKDMARIQSEAESLKLIPFPTHYSFFTTVFIWLLVILLSLSLPANENSGYYAIPLVVLVGWIFTMIEGIGKYMDNPWSNNRNVVPTHYFSQVLDSDMRAMVFGETDFPKPPAAVDGALY
jgi:putative membrane protein